MVLGAVCDEARSLSPRTNTELAIKHHTCFICACTSLTKGGVLAETRETAAAGLIETLTTLQGDDTGASADLQAASSSILMHHSPRPLT